MAAKKAGFAWTKGWQKMRALVSPGAFTANMEHELDRANRLIGARIVAEIRRDIDHVISPGNTGLTVFIKGSTKPLVDDGDLRGAVTWVRINSKVIEVGVLKGDPNVNTAITVHEGVEIPVTAKMRGMFKLLQAASEGKLSPSKLEGRAKVLFERRQLGWVRLKPGTTHIRIPGRPFLRRTIENKAILDLIVKKLWQQAIERALKKGA